MIKFGSGQEQRRLILKADEQNECMAVTLRGELRKRLPEMFEQL